MPGPLSEAQLWPCTGITQDRRFRCRNEKFGQRARDRSECIGIWSQLVHQAIHFLNRLNSHRATAKLSPQILV
jgi:hypothetical protein